MNYINLVIFIEALKYIIRLSLYLKRKPTVFLFDLNELRKKNYIVINCVKN